MVDAKWNLQDIDSTLTTTQKKKSKVLRKKLKKKKLKGVNSFKALPFRASVLSTGIELWRWPSVYIIEGKDVEYWNCMKDKRG